jgi:hypothetical protein
MSLALLLILLIRGVTEVPLSLTGFGTETLTHLLLIVVLAVYYAPAQSRGRRPSFTPVLQRKGLA